MVRKCECRSVGEPFPPSSAELPLQPEPASLTRYVWQWQFQRRVLSVNVELAQSHSDYIFVIFRHMIVKVRVFRFLT